MQNEEFTKSTIRLKKKIQDRVDEHCKSLKMSRAAAIEFLVAFALNELERKQQHEELKDDLAELRKCMAEMHRSLYRPIAYLASAGTPDQHRFERAKEGADKSVKEIFNGQA